MLHISRFRRSLEIITNDFSVIIIKVRDANASTRHEVTNPALNRLYTLINQSILAGEYVEDINIVKNEIDESRTNLTILLTQIEQEVSDADMSALFYTFITVLQNCLNGYASMCIRIENMFSVNDEVNLNRDYDRDEIASQCQILLNKHSVVNYAQFNEKLTYKAYEILLINLHTALLDLSCNPNDKLLYKLNSIEDELNALYADVTLKAFEFIFGIREKVKFIKLKVLIRFYQIQVDLGVDLKVIQDSKQLSIERLIDEIEFPELRAFLEYSYSHYIESVASSQKILARYRSIGSNQDSYYLRHLRIKYLKDIKKDVIGLEEIVKKFDADYKSVDTPFNHYAKGMSLNYANNNLFSSKLDNPDLDYETALRLYEEIKKVSIETGIKNYFPDLRFLKFLTEKLNALLEQADALKKIESINRYLKQCSKLIDSYRKNVNWTKHNHSYIYQLPFNECIFNNAFTNKARLRHFFTASNIVLPLNKEQYNLEYTDYNNQIKVFNSIKNTMNNLSVESLKVEKLAGELATKDVKYIEILGIFCAVSTFVSAAILSILTAKEDSIDGMSNTLAFLLSTGIVMFSFLGLLVFVLNKSSVSKRFSLVLLLILILLIITCNNS